MTRVQKKTWKLEKFEAHLTFNTFFQFSRNLIANPG